MGGSRYGQEAGKTNMLDQLSKLYIEVTASCNLNCVMCIQRVWDEPIGLMKRDDYAALMDQVRSLDAPPIIHLSGFGEPLTHPHILDLVALAKSTGAEVEMTTNGMLLNESKCKALMDLELDRLVVSVDGATAESFE